ncbi:MAG: hypothetical protein CSA62_13970 [Planctomycetota bacterium]|nr:MAG: hypothetical protein CSA62_13970 [Planctomycetota bacterium]
MDRVEKLLMLGVLGIALAIVAVLAFESGAEAKPKAKNTDSIVNAPQGERAGRSLKEDEEAQPEEQVLTDLLGLDAKKKTPSLAESEDSPAMVKSIKLDDKSSAKVSPSMYWCEEKFGSYVVGRGDSLDRILQRYCGFAGPKTKRRIEMLNEGVDWRRLRPGQRILIPVELLHGSNAGLERSWAGASVNATPSVSRSSSSLARQSRQTPSPKTGAEDRSPQLAPKGGAAAGEEQTEEYRVQPGDSLWGIAQRRVPPGVSAYSLVKRLEALNRERLGDASKLKVGQVLLVPVIAPR